MNFRPLASVATLAAGLLAFTSVSAYDSDKYGRKIYTPADWVRDNAANTQSMIDSNRAFQAETDERLAQWKREVAEREAYNSPEAREARRRSHEESVAEWMQRLDLEAAARAHRDQEEAAQRKALAKGLELYQRNNTYNEELKARIATGDTAAARELLRIFENCLKFNANAATGPAAFRGYLLDLTGQPEGAIAALAKESPRGVVWQLAWQATEKMKRNYDPWPAIRRLATTPGPTANDHCLLLLAHEFDQTEAITSKKQETLGRRCLVPEARRQLLMEVLSAEIHRSAWLSQYTLRLGSEFMKDHSSAIELLLDQQSAIDAGFGHKKPSFNIYAAGIEEAYPEFQATAGFYQPGHTHFMEYVTVKPHPVRFFAPLEAPTSDPFYIMDPSVAVILHEKMRQATNLGLREDTAQTASSFAAELEYRVSGLDFVMGVRGLQPFYNTHKNGDQPDYHFGDTMPGGKDGRHRILPGLIPIFTALATTRPDELAAWLRTAPTLPRLRDADAAELSTCHDLALAIASEAATPAARQQLTQGVNATFHPLELVHALALREKYPEAFYRLVFAIAATGSHAADPLIFSANETLAAVLSAPEGDEAAAKVLDARWSSVKEMAANPAMRPLLAPALLKAALNIRTGQEEIRAAAGTVREFEVSRKFHPPYYRAVPMMLLLLEWKEVSPEVRTHGVDLLVDCAKGEGFAVDQVVSVLEQHLAGETDPLADLLAPLAELSDNLTANCAVQFRLKKFPRERLHYASPWDAIPRLNADYASDVPPATLSVVNAFRESAVGSPQRAKLANALVEIQLKADRENPFERLAELNLEAAGGSALDDGVSAFALAMLRLREQTEIPWSHPPADRLDQAAIDLIAQRGDERSLRTRQREAVGFAALVFAHQKNIPGARELLLKRYDPQCDLADTLFALGEDTAGYWQNLGTRALLAAVGTTDAASWLQRITALPEEFTSTELAAGYVAAARAHPHPEKFTAQLIRLLWHDQAENPARLTLRQLIAGPDAPRLFGPAWQDESPSPFKTEWMLELLDAKAEELLPAPENAPATFCDQQVRERVRRLTPHVAMLVAFSSERTTSALGRTLAKDARGFLDNLAKFAAQEDPALIPLYHRFAQHHAGLQPITPEHWALLAEGRLWPLPAGFIEAQ